MKHIKKIIFGVIAIAVLGLGLSSLVVTYDNEYKLVKKFSKVDRVITTSGVQFKIPFIEQTDTLPRSVQLYDMATSDVITKDKKTMVTDTFVLWRITEPLKFAQSLNSIPNAQNRINTVVYNYLKNIIGSLDQAEVISARDGELSTSVMEGIHTTMEQYGIEIVSVETKHLDLPSDNKTAVYERMISEREQMAANYIAEGKAESQIIKNNTDKEIAIQIAKAKAQAAETIAAGEAEYMKILSKAYSSKEKSEFYSFVRALDAAKLSLTGDNKTLILDSNSPLTQIFKGE